MFVTATVVMNAWRGEIDLTIPVASLTKEVGWANEHRYLPEIVYISFDIFVYRAILAHKERILTRARLYRWHLLPALSDQRN
jgi:hypothetical protein